jgi:hypothetical protein
MKNSLVKLMLFSLLAFAACKPESTKPYQDVVNGDVASLIGTWKGASVNLRDVGAENKGFPYKSEDMTDALSFTGVKLTLNGNGTTPTTFSFDYGTSPEFFKFKTGNWKVDNANKVGKIYLINNLDTISVVLGSYQDLLNNKMSITQTKTLLGKPALIYQYRFSK